MVERSSATSVRHVRAVSPREATGLVATVYDQMRREFLVVPPLTLHSPAPEILAGAWCVVRETLVCGDVARTRKEAVASAVSRRNSCPFCVDAHLMAIEAAGQSRLSRAIESGDAGAIDDAGLRELVRWGEATRTPGDARLASPPFPSTEAPEFFGTALLFHYINRMVHVFCDDSPLPVAGLPPRLHRFLRRMTATRFGDWFERRHQPGLGLSLVPAADVPAGFEWSQARPTVAAAWAGFHHVVDRLAREVAAPAVLTTTTAAIEDWNGEEPPLGRAWIEERIASLPEKERIASRLALSVALAPARTDPAWIAAYRELAGSDGAVITLAAWASLKATGRVAAWIAPRN